MTRLILVPILLLLAGPALAFDHSLWNSLLEEHVQWQRQGVTSAVDYQGINSDREELDAYLQRLSDVSPRDFNQWDREEKLAFLINAYNAFTVDLILRQETLPASIRDIGTFFSGPWDQRFFTLLGKPRTLDEVEHTLIRANPDLMDPRIHFAVNCASIGCPALRPEAYQRDRLEQQLADGTQRFLSDRERNRFNAAEGSLEVSKIFDWYEEDFEDNAGSLALYLKQFSVILDIPDKHRTSGSLRIEFLDYDWSLNKN